MDGWGRAFLGVVVGVVVGFLLGGAGPRRESAALRKENETLGDELLSARKKGGRQMQFLPIPASDGTPRSRPSVTPIATGEDASASPAPTIDDSPDIEKFRLAIDAQKLRIRQSRAVITEKAGLNAEEEGDLDQVLEKMNEDLAKHAEKFADAIFSGEEQQPIEMLGMTHDVTGILLDAQQQYEKMLGPDFAQLDENTASVWNFVDLTYFQAQFENAAANNGP